MPALFHYAPIHIDLLDDREYHQEQMDKPDGLWLSVDDCKDNWSSYCEAVGRLPENLVFRHRIHLKRDHRVLVLDTKDRMLEFSKQFVFAFDDRARSVDTFPVDWPKVADQWDGIVISPYHWPCRMNPKTLWYYLWDCACGCIWNTGCIARIEPMTKGS